MKLKHLLFLVLLLGCCFTADSVSARKKLNRQTAPIALDSVWNKLILRSDHNALLLQLGGMQYASAVDYTLTYTSAAVPQGIQGYHLPEKGNTQIELLFGTCSGNDCSYHQDITDMVFELRIKLQAGGTLVKRYQISP